jgi:hypothetical protein
MSIAVRIDKSMDGTRRIAAALAVSRLLFFAELKGKDGHRDVASSGVRTAAGGANVES